MTVNNLSLDEKEIWEINLQMGSQSIVGHEQGASRPCVIMKVLPSIQMATVIPLTSQLRVLRFPYTSEILSTPQNGLTTTSIAMIFQIRSVSFHRFQSKYGILENEDFSDIQDLICDFIQN
ncbi:MAG: type II toxin-antitoxin system PemK/MazF family toxin [Promethearchaeota archaeon]